MHLIDDLITDTDKESNVGDLRVSMQENMQKYSSVFKSKDLLETGYKNIEKLIKKKVLIKDDSLVWNTDLVEALELINMLDLAYLTVGASLFREESRGSHYRYDYPIKETMIIGCIIHYLGVKTKNSLNLKSDVNFDGLYKDEMETIPPKKEFIKIFILFKIIFLK